MDTLLAGAGYDGEGVHEFLRDELGIRSIIPPTIGRRTDKPPAGHHRRQMRWYFQRPRDPRRYGQRWQVETVSSMIKRRLGQTLSARGFHRQARAIFAEGCHPQHPDSLAPRGFLRSRTFYSSGFLGGRRRGRGGCSRLGRAAVLRGAIRCGRPAGTPVGTTPVGQQMIGAESAGATVLR
ncbi:MAG: transposase, partial [Planctomycetes bacterium]|nr:transposase [Planctomycetota bacterium]